MLAVRDHLERALSHVPEAALADEKVKSFVDGIGATLRELDAVFARQGIVRVEAVGQPLDPHKHQAMIEIATDNADPGTVVEEMQSGYMLKDLAAPGIGGGRQGRLGLPPLVEDQVSPLAILGRRRGVDEGQQRA
jgi:molecular chaperone GrpE